MGLRHRQPIARIDRNAIARIARRESRDSDLANCHAAAETLLRRADALASAPAAAETPIDAFTRRVQSEAARARAEGLLSAESLILWDIYGANVAAHSVMALSALLAASRRPYEERLRLVSATRADPVTLPPPDPGDRLACLHIANAPNAPRRAILAAA
jgi:hypothetical protein